MVPKKGPKAGPGELGRWGGPHEWWRIRKADSDYGYYVGPSERPFTFSYQGETHTVEAL